jgi:hypothetical protein
MSKKIFVIIMATMKRKRARKTKNRKRTRKTYKGGLYARLKVSPSNIVVDDNYFYSKLNQCKEILDDLSEKIPLLKDGKVLGSEIPLLKDDIDRKVLGSEIPLLRDGKVLGSVKSKYSILPWKNGLYASLEKKKNRWVL